MLPARFAMSVLLLGTGKGFMQEFFRKFGRGAIYNKGVMMAFYCFHHAMLIVAHIRLHPYPAVSNFNVSCMTGTLFLGEPTCM
jgi:hypothetical protein